jgi:hypothetical protein
MQLFVPCPHDALNAHPAFPSGWRDTECRADGLPVRRCRSAGWKAAVIAAVAGWCAFVPPAQGAKSLPAPAIGLEEFSQLDCLPRLKAAMKVASFSSYDRSGGNDDGFSGKYSFIRKEGDGLVLAEMEGPGAIYRIHTPTPTEDPVEFFFDGEAQPRLRLKLRELFDGSRPPFLAPLASFGSGGFYCYVPLLYKKSCKIVIRAPRMQFYQINYATYPPGTELETFSPGAQALSGAVMERARKVLGMAGQDLSAGVVPDGAQLRRVAVTRTLAPGKTATLFEVARGGRIAGLRLHPADALAGNDRGIVLRIFWDYAREPAVLCPAGDFFGYSWGEPAARSLLIGTEGNTAYSYFPMPFDHSARIELVSQKTSGPAVDVRVETVWAPLPRRKDEGRFYALWRRENPTTKGRPFTFVETKGRGHLVGVTLQAQGLEPGPTPFFEGDDEATLDGELSVHGNGSEDFFNGGWYDVPGRWEGRASYPLSGCLDYLRAQGRSGGYRLMLTDTYSFCRSLNFTIEHAPTDNDLLTDYAGVSYLYLENPPPTPWGLAEPAARAVRNPDRLIFTPGWSLPIRSFSIQDATLAKKTEKIGESVFRFLSLRAQGGDIFGAHHICFLCAVPAPGRYRVIIEPMVGPDQAIAQPSEQEHPVGTPADFYAEKRGAGKATDMGTLTMKAGPNPVFLKLTGKNDRSRGLGLDIVSLVLERVP